jgi:hypothetical protein
MRCGGVGPCIAERSETSSAIGDPASVFNRSRVDWPIG